MHCPGGNATNSIWRVLASSDGIFSWTPLKYVSVSFFPSLKQNFITYRSSKVSSRPDCIFEIHQLWQSDFSRVYSNCCCSCSFEAEIIKIGQSSHKMYSNNIVNFQESTTIFNAWTKKSLETNWMHHTHTHTHTYIYIYMCVCVCVCVWWILIYNHEHKLRISIFLRNTQIQTLPWFLRGFSFFV